MLRTLFARLSAALILVSLALSFGLVAVLQWSHEAFHLELEQRQHRHLAATLLAAAPESETPFEDAFQRLRQLNILNPAIAGYAVEPDGAITASSTGVSNRARTAVAVAPIVEFIHGPKAWPLLGQDPAKKDGQAIFSAAAVGAGQRYLYVVLGSAGNGEPDPGAERPYALRDAVWLTLGNVAAALLAALVVVAAITRPLRRLRRAMVAFDASKLAGNIRYRQEKVRAAPDEIDRLGEIFDTMADRIAAQMDSLRRMDAARRELYANVSHDLQTPLTSLKGYVQTLLIKNGALSSDQRRRYLEIVERQTEQLRELVNQITDLARLETPELRLQQERVELAQLLRQIVENLKPLSDEKALNIVLDLSAGLATFLGDPNLLRRALTNILLNALQAAPQATEVHIEAMHDQANVVINVVDAGPGLRAGDNRRIFEPHYRGWGEARPGSPGMGLGLAIASRIIELHGGEVSASNVPDAGALVRIVLPLH